MKIAISLEKDILECDVDQRFGRCKYFLITDSNDVEKYEIVKNQGIMQDHGAGIKSAQQMIELGVEVVLTGSLGPNATNVLKQASIKPYHASGNTKDVINKFTNGKLDLITEVSESHPESNESDTKIVEEVEERMFFPLLKDLGMDSEISQHFGHAPFFGIYNVKTKEFKIIENDLNHTDPTKSPIDQIQESVNPTTIFARGIGGRAIQLIQEKGLSLKTGDYATVKEVIANLDKLKDQTDSCGHEH